MKTRRGKDERSKIIRALDRITPKIVKLRDGYQCQRCGGRAKAQGCHWAHVYGRSRFSLRWRLLNGLCLCFGCHQWGHSNPLAFRKWFASKFPARAPYLEELYKRPVRAIKTEILRITLGQHKEKLAQLESEFKEM